MSNEYIFRSLGVTRQGLAQFRHRQEAYVMRVDEAEAELIIMRKVHPGLGLVKAYYQIKPEQLGRDRFVLAMTRRGWALRRPRSYVRTTRSDGYRYPNLVTGLVINAINLVWQSDTTYFRIKEDWYYITFIIDVYSRLIVGYHADRSLRATANVSALDKALKQRKGHDLKQLIFHSDGGTQYRFKPFVERLRSQGISSSMCTAATDNAYAEKLNDVIKNEYLVHFKMGDLPCLGRILKRSVDNYNCCRHHGQLPMRSCPRDYESWLSSPQGWVERIPLLIRDGQQAATNWEPDMVEEDLMQPVARATKGLHQILPAHVKLDLPTEDRQLTLHFK